MKTYDRLEAKHEAAALATEQLEPQPRANFRALALSPLGELFRVHPGPWTIEAHKAWRGTEPPDPIIFDAAGRVVDICDDTAARPAIVEAFNIALRNGPWQIMGSIESN